MTAPDAPSSARAPSESSTSSRRSPAVIAVIVIVVIVVIAGGAFVVYKLTDKKDVPTPAFKVAAITVQAARTGDQATVAANSTAAGANALGALDPAGLQGLKETTCGPSPLAPEARVCVFSRPGGQLTVSLTQSGSDWKVVAARLGPAGLPPTSTTTTT
jgi:hypothetical protein